MELPVHPRIFPAPDRGVQRQHRQSAFTSLQNAKSFNADVLFTYMVHPGTAIYVGYNTDLANIYRPLTSSPTDYTEYSAPIAISTMGASYS